MANWVIDLDGVMWRGVRPIEGSAEAVGNLLASGDRVLFCTNNSTASGAQRAAQLAERGLPDDCEVVTSADAVCTLVEHGERVLVLGSSGLVEALTIHGAQVESTRSLVASRAPADDALARFDAVVVGLARDFDYAQLDLAVGTVQRGARLLASNSDTTFPGPDGVHAGTGAILAAVEAATGVCATVAGKPLEPMARLIRDRFHGSVAATVVVGDRPDTDGRLAERLGVPFLLVLSGVTSDADLPSDVPTATVSPDLATLVHSGAGRAHR